MFAINKSLVSTGCGASGWLHGIGVWRGVEDSGNRSRDLYLASALALA